MNQYGLCNLLLFVFFYKIAIELVVSFLKVCLFNVLVEFHFTVLSCLQRLTRKNKDELKLW